MAIFLFGCHPFYTWYPWAIDGYNQEAFETVADISKIENEGRLASQENDCEKNDYPAMVFHYGRTLFTQLYTTALTLKVQIISQKKILSTFILHVVRELLVLAK